MARPVSTRDHDTSICGHHLRPYGSKLMYASQLKAPQNNDQPLTPSSHESS
jgi:hypothetical protein